MAKKIRFPLQMNGADVRTIEELRQNFDLESVLGYFANGKLVTWLKDRYYDDEAMAVEALSADDTDLNQKLMSILGISADTEIEEIDMEVIQRRNEKLMLLRQITDDKEIIDNVDSVAFNQDDLYSLYDEGIKKIYLVQGKFEVPFKIRNVVYFGIANPTVIIRKSKEDNIYNTDITFHDVLVTYENKDVTSLFSGEVKKNEEHNKEENPESLYQMALNYEKGENGFIKSLEKAAQCYLKAAELGHVESQKKVGWCYQNGNGVNQSWEQALKWYIKASDNGNAWASAQLGWMYFVGKGCKLDRDKAFEYYMKGAEGGNAYAQMEVGDCYIYGNGVNRNERLGKEWLLKAANSNYLPAQCRLGRFLDEDKDYIQAFKWLKKAADAGYAEAQYWVGFCYEANATVANPMTRYGVIRNEDTANEWYAKAAKQGYEPAQERIKQLNTYFGCHIVY